MWVDTGTTLSVIPKIPAEKLGLQEKWRERVRLAGTQEEKWPVAELRLAVDGQEVVTYCFIAPRAEPLLGALALESLFLAVDPVGKRLIPTHGYALAAAGGPPAPLAGGYLDRPGAGHFPHITREEVDRVLQVGDRLGFSRQTLFMIRVLWATGARISEVLALRCEDLDRERRTLRIRRRRKVSPKMFRHGVAYELVQSGAHPLLVSRALGHASLSSALAYYHPSEENLRAVMERRAALTSPGAAGPSL